MSPQEYVTGFALTVGLFALPLAMIISWGLLSLYRRAVIRLMETRSMLEPPTVSGDDSLEKVASPREPLALNIITHTSDTLLLPDAEKFYQTGKFALWHRVLVYGLGIVSFALLLAIGNWNASQFDFHLQGFAHIFWAYLWLVVPVLWVIIGHRRLVVVGVYILGFAFLGLCSAATNPAFEWTMPLILWYSINLWPTFALFIMLNRRVRAVGSLVLVFVIFAIVGVMALVLGIGESGSVFIRWGAVLGLNLWQINLLSYCIVLAGLAGFGLVGWLVLKRIRYRYERKKISDQSLIVDTIWLLFLAPQIALFLMWGLGWAVYAAGAYLVSKMLVSLGFSLLRRAIRNQHSQADLLLLRVFSLGKRSERFYDAISTHWRYVGNLRMIAGPDLATTTIEPHEFLDYLTGKLDNCFIDSEEILERRLAEVDDEPDYDGRYRVSEFFCHADIWKSVLARLASTHDAVVMDLRSFSAKNAGCIFEINTLLDLVSLDKVVLVVDETTDDQFLRQTLSQSWMDLDINSPNRKTPGAVNLFRFEGSNLRGFSKLLRILCSAAAADSKLV